MLAATDPELVRLQMDVYWMTKGGRNAAAEIRRLGSRVGTLHLKDMDATPKRAIVTIGQGTIDFTAVLRAARDAGVTDVFVEEDDPADPMAAARQSYAHLVSLDL
jgi:sugar phosphate isomerase/epimerase